MFTRKYQNTKRKEGFTLIEILLVIALIAILAAIVIVAVNPARQLGQAQDAQRQSDVKTILDAVGQYTIDNSGTLPSGIPTGATCETNGQDICKADASCEGVSLDVLLTNRTYLTALPEDPTAATSDTTGYRIMQNSERVTVCAPTTYGSSGISVSR